ncbi:hypothetical protein Pmani_007249 [Petrolisthes manimaculis]|uniref:Uncharacterized protein n=1 Tax=Petrolisthes manimaculis TaxID=1843537 RepID=A0AAE1UIV9_9EUCA|nr:hypothetical protein Pmani_007249 [Petrolisthes manimaculis]
MEPRDAGWREVGCGRRLGSGNVAVHRLDSDPTSDTINALCLSPKHQTLLLLLLLLLLLSCIISSDANRFLCTLSPED